MSPQTQPERLGAPDRGTAQAPEDTAPDREARATPAAPDGPPTGQPEPPRGELDRPTQDGAPRRAVRVWRGIIAEYRDRLPLGPGAPVVTLGEGGTPLIYSERLSARTGGDVWLKYEGANPTGSFKDRGMTVAISKAVEEGARAVICASTGNTSASAAAYAAKAGLVCGVLVPKGKVALGKLAQALIHGARVIQIEGSFDLALEISRTLDEKYPVQLVNSLNPYRIDGQRTGAWEVCDQLGRAPDVHVMPVGNAGNITAYWRGYTEARDIGWSGSLPKMFGFQAEGANPIVRGEPIDEPKTVATAIRIGNPASWDGALEAARDSGGAIQSVWDRDIIEGYRSLAEEGIFVELASAASLAGLRMLAAQGGISRDATVVCILTGHGLKDPDWAISAAPRPKRVEATIDVILQELELA